MENQLRKLLNKDFIIHMTKYLIFGVLTTVVNIGLFWLFVNMTPLGESDVGKNTANVVAIIASIVFAYFTNRRYVFNSKETKLWKEMAKFFMARGFTFGFDVGTFFIFATLLNFNEMIVKIVIQFAVIVLNYILSRILVFKKEEAKV